MAAEDSLSTLTLSASSIADDLSFIALHDLSCALHDVPSNSYRVIGGHMMTALTGRWRLGDELYRETRDADVGVPPIVIREHNFVKELLRLDYKQVDGSRFEREIPDLRPNLVGNEVPNPHAAIDILFPAYTSRARPNKSVGDSIVATEAQGLATALLRPPVEMTLNLWRLDSTKLEANLLYPDEVAALVL